MLKKHRPWRARFSIERAVDLPNTTAQLPQGLLNIKRHLLQRMNSFYKFRPSLHHLILLAIFVVIHPQDFAHFVQAVTQPAATQYNDNTSPVLVAVKPHLTTARRHDELFVLVKSQGTCGDMKLFGESADGVDATTHMNLNGSVRG